MDVRRWPIGSALGLGLGAAGSGPPRYGAAQDDFVATGTGAVARVLMPAGVAVLAPVSHRALMGAGPVGAAAGPRAQERL
ncbi:hypothetical protein [Streptomyces sp. NPDC002209]|uniref:hypothetical protein n=1 Tax=Streptomyces sp. NPDC002209 TaxID=3364638 RepID=UPI0036CD6C61